MFRSFLRPIAALATLAGLAAYATIMLRGPQGLNALAEKHRQVRSVEEVNATLARENAAKRAYIERLTNDPTAQEVELRKLGFLHEQDTQFRVTGQHVAVPATSKPADRQ
jgi:cell division protein FtsB